MFDGVVVCMLGCLLSDLLLHSFHIEVVLLRNVGFWVGLCGNFSGCVFWVWLVLFRRYVLWLRC